MRHSPLTVVTICTVLSMLDGFDVLVMAFTAPGVANEWSLTGAQLGVLLSSALFGMGAGSLLIAPLADRYGRRRIVILCLSVITAGLLLSAASQTAMQLGILRAITGLGIGGMLASLNVLTAEFATDRWRSTAISLQATGYPIGATLGGLAAAALIAQYGWRSAFVFGGLCSALMLPVVLARLPESADFLRSRARAQGGAVSAGQAARSAREHERISRRSANGAASQSAVEQSVPVSTTPAPFPVRQLFAGNLWRPTLLLWSSFFLLMFSLYFVLSWTPRLLVSAGLTEQQGIAGGVLLNLGGIIGGAGFAWLAAKMDARWLTVIYMAAFAVLTALFGAVATQLAAAYVTAWALGVFLFGAMVGLYVLAPAIYPASIRTTGMGCALGIGRIGAILSPAAAGYLIDAGSQPSQLYFLFAAPLLAAVLTTQALRPVEKSAVPPVRRTAE